MQTPATDNAERIATEALAACIPNWKLLSEEQQREGIDFILRNLETDTFAGPPEWADPTLGDLEKALSSARDAMEPAEPAEGDSKPTAAVEAVKLLRDVELFHDQLDRPLASIENDGKPEHLLVRSNRFRMMVKHRYWRVRGKSLSAQQENEALGIIESKAMFEGKRRDSYVRVAPDGGDGIYFDLGPKGDILHITPDGVETLTRQPPVLLYRPKGMVKLPDPQWDSSPEELRQFLNLETDDDFRLILVQVLSWLVPSLEKPGMDINGEQGAAKTTLAEIIKILIDPHVALQRVKPKELRDLAIAAANQHVLFLDNLSYLEDNLSDALCGLTTGYGFTTRALYTDEEETIFSLKRPYILTGINPTAKRSDLLDRLITYHCPRIPEENRQPESALWERFHAVHPRMLGALLQALADTLRTWPTIEPPKKAPRMADFYVFGLAVEEALEWPVGTFDRAYRENIERRNETAIESEPVAAEIMKHIEGEFIGTPTELLEYLNERVDETVQKGKRWPRAANALTGKLRRVASNLRAAGWTVEPDRHDPVGNRQVYLSHPSLRSDDSDDLFGNEMKEEGNKREEEGEAEGEHTYKWRKKPSKPSNRQSDRDAAEFEADNPFMNKGSEE